MNEERSKAVVLLSGGLDSATAAAIAKDRGFALYALTISYGQRHAIEAQAAKRIVKAFGITGHVVQTIDLRVFGGSALTDHIDVPKSRDVDHRPAGIPVTYVPARNTIFLALALGYAEVIGSSDIFLGVSAVDYSGYPDCRPLFIEAFERLANVATKAAEECRRIRIHAPLIALSKAQIIREGTRLGLDYGLTHSCYDPTSEGFACGFCDSCLLRKRGFEEAGLIDSISYAPSPNGP